MIAVVTPGPLRGTIPAIPSKSAAHRLLICAAFSLAPTVLQCTVAGRDMAATVRCLRALGAEIEEKDGSMTVIPITKPTRDAVLDVGESGSTLRFLLPVVCALGVPARFRLHGRLARRPLEPLWSELTRCGAVLEQDGDEIAVSGTLRENRFALAANVSSQFLSGILMALPLLGGGELTLTTELQSAGYLAMTEDALRRFGAEITHESSVIRMAPGKLRSPGACPVEGDWSNAAFWLCAGVAVTGLEHQSRQGDRIVPACIGAIRAGNAVIDCGQIPDLVPPLAALAATCPGTTRFVNGSRLRLKESDRIATTVRMLTDLGARAGECPDGLWVAGAERLPGGTVDGAGDHRIVMAAAIAAASCGNPVIITGAQAAEKSYAAFWDDFVRLGGNVRWEAEP